MTAHDHTTLVTGCYRCELNRDEMSTTVVPEQPWHTCATCGARWQGTHECSNAPRGTSAPYVSIRLTPKLCVCGHVEAHHAPPVGGYPAQECNWQGCGCPRFVGGDAS